MKSEVVITANELPPDVIDAIRDGRKVEAIKILREAKGIGLANAKVLVEHAWRTHGPAKQYVSFADQPQGLRRLTKSLVVLLGLIAAYYFFTGT